MGGQIGQQPSRSRGQNRRPETQSAGRVPQPVRPRPPAPSRRRTGRRGGPQAQASAADRSTRSRRLLPRSAALRATPPEQQDAVATALRPSIEPRERQTTRRPRRAARSLAAPPRAAERTAARQDRDRPRSRSPTVAGSPKPGYAAWYGRLPSRKVRRPALGNDFDRRKEESDLLGGVRGGIRAVHRIRLDRFGKILANRAR